MWCSIMKNEVIVKALEFVKHAVRHVATYSYFGRDGRTKLKISTITHQIEQLYKNHTNWPPSSFNLDIFEPL